MMDEFDYDFLQWYHWAYCLEDFETITLYRKHKKAAHSGWVAARERTQIKPLSDRSTEA